MSKRSEETVLALDNVPLELPVASAGPRLLAGALDYLVVGLLALAFSLLCWGLARRFESSWFWIACLGLLGLFVIEYLKR